MMSEAPSTAIAESLSLVRQRIRNAEQRFDREPGSVALLAVSKTKPLSAVQLALEAGQHLFGENYVNEGVEKIVALGTHEGEWHFIGALQSNKTKLVAEHYHWMHSVDRLKIAQRLSEQRPAHLPPLNLCLQLNLDQQASKSGLDAHELLPLADQVAALPNIRLRGVMSIPEPRETFEAQRDAFAKVRELYETLQQRHEGVDTLSMGMTGDLEAAIAEGATIVRIGTAIFGARASKPAS